MQSLCGREPQSARLGIYRRGDGFYIVGESEVCERDVCVVFGFFGESSWALGSFRRCEAVEGNNKAESMVHADCGAAPVAVVA